MVPCARMSMIKKTIKFFDKLEDRVRGKLSRQPIVYTLIGGVAIVLFWRGVWLTADMFPFMTGPISILISVLTLLVTGLFVSFFISDRIILSGLKREKKLVEKTEEEVHQEKNILLDIESKVDTLQASVNQLERELAEKDSR